jgi:hypothetical protein
MKKKKPSPHPLSPTEFFAPGIVSHPAPFEADESIPSEPLLQRSVFTAPKRGEGAKSWIRRYHTIVSAARKLTE